MTLNNHRLRHILLLTSLVLLPLQSVIAQKQTPVDSLRIVLIGTEQDTSKVNILAEISQSYVSANPDSAKSYAEQAMAIAEKTGYTYGKALSKQALASSYWKSSQHKKALSFIEQALELYEKAGRTQSAVKLLNEWVILFFYEGEGEKAIIYGGKYLEIARQIKDEKHEAAALYELGFLYHRVSGDAQKGMEAYKQGEKLIEKFGVSAGYVDILTGISQLYINQGKYELGLEYAFKALNMQRKIGSDDTLGEQYRTLGWIYMDLEDYDKSLNYFKQALEVFTAVAYPVGMGYAHEDMAGAYTKNKEYEKGLEHYTKALAIYKKENYDSGIAGAIYGLGRVHKYLGNYEEALKYSKKSLEIDTQASQPLYYSHFALGELYFEMGILNKAYQHTKQSFAMLKQINFTEYIKQTSELLVKITRKQGKYKEALMFQDEYLIARDSLFNQKNIHELAELEANFKYEKEALKDSVANAEKEKVITAQLDAEKAVSAKKEQQLYFSFGGVAILLLFVGYISNRYRLINQQKKIIEDQKLQVDKKNNENELLLKEIHHRVKNNLQIISSLLNLQTKNTEDEVALAAMNDGQNRVKAMALIHQGLYQNKDMATIKFQEYAEELLRQLASIYPNGNNVIKSVKTNDIELDIDTAVPLGLILNELVSNSFKYAFEGIDKAQIQIQLQQQEDSFELKVSDNGKGLPEAFEWQKTKSIGLRLVRRLSKQLYGNFSYEFQDGAHFIIKFQDTATRKLIS